MPANFLHCRVNLPFFLGLKHTIWDAFETGKCIASVSSFSINWHPIGRFLPVTTISMAFLVITFISGISYSFIVIYLFIFEAGSYIAQAGPQLIL